MSITWREVIIVIFLKIKDITLINELSFTKRLQECSTLRELRIETMEDNDKVRMIWSQKKRLEVINESPKLILTKPSYTSKMDYSVMPRNYDYTSNIKTSVSLFKIKINRLTRSGHCFTLEKIEKQRKAKG